MNENCARSGDGVLWCGAHCGTCEDNRIHEEEDTLRAGIERLKRELAAAEDEASYESSRYATARVTVERLKRAIRAEWDCQDAPKPDCTALYCLHYTDCKAAAE